MVKPDAKVEPWLDLQVGIGVFEDLETEAGTLGAGVVAGDELLEPGHCGK